MKKINFFCTSHQNINYLDKFYPTIQMVGLGDSSLHKSWININNEINISNKFLSYADLIAQYYVWKNLLIKYDDSQWIGFLQYRRFWLKHKISKEYPLDSIDNLILIEPDLTWEDYEAIIPAPFIFKKKIKELLKNFFLFKFFKNLDYIKYYTKVQKQFEDSLGSGGREIIADTIKLLSKDRKSTRLNSSHVSESRMPSSA